MAFKPLDMANIAHVEPTRATQPSFLFLPPFPYVIASSRIRPPSLTLPPTRENTLRILSGRRVRKVVRSASSRHPSSIVLRTCGQPAGFNQVLARLYWRGSRRRWVSGRWGYYSRALSGARFISNSPSSFSPLPDKQRDGKQWRPFLSLIPVRDM